MAQELQGSIFVFSPLDSGSCIYLYMVSSKFYVYALQSSNRTQKERVWMNFVSLRSLAIFNERGKRNNGLVAHHFLLIHVLRVPLLP